MTYSYYPNVVIRVMLLVVSHNYKKYSSTFYFLGNTQT